MQFLWSKSSMEKWKVYIRVKSLQKAKIAMEKIQILIVSQLKSDHVCWK